MKITIAIPNYNGASLLQKNLPNILVAGADEVLVIDDGSKDESLQILKDFKDVKILVNKKNLGFIPSVNQLFKEALGDIVVLLNNDVYIREDFLKYLLPHFQNKQVFAVNLHEKGEGWADAFWKDGFFEFKRGEESEFVHKSSWASGGSAAYSKKIWQDLGGFDNMYAPFYWEDVDISFKALKAGYEILWEPKALVYHNHETTIKKSFNKEYIDWVKQRNQLLFIWKNITDKNLMTDHQKNLLKRLFRVMGLGYWIPYLWAMLKKSQIKKEVLKKQLSDQEVIDYVRS